MKDYHIFKSKLLTDYELIFLNISNFSPYEIIGDEMLVFMQYINHKM